MDVRDIFHRWEMYNYDRKSSSMKVFKFQIFSLILWVNIHEYNNSYNNSVQPLESLMC